MFHVKVYLAPSPVHGTGLFADQSIKAGERIYTENPELDLQLTTQAFNALEEKEQLFIQHYGFFDTHRERWHLSHDHIRFCNHAGEGSNITLINNAYLAAKRDIEKGEELLQDYREISTYEGRNLKD